MAKTRFVTLLSIKVFNSLKTLSWLRRRAFHGVVPHLSYQHAATLMADLHNDATSEAHRNYSEDRTFCCGQCMQKERQQLLLITSYNGVYQVGYKIPIHSLRHAVEVLPQPSYVTSLCKSAIVAGAPPLSFSLSELTLINYMSL